MIVPVGNMPSSPPNPPGVEEGQENGQATSFFLQLLAQVQGQQIGAADLEGALRPLATPAPETPERRALESILLTLETIVPYLSIAFPPVGQPVAVQADIRRMLPIGPRQDTTSIGVTTRQGTTPPLGVPVLPSFLAPENQPTVATYPDAVQPATADSASPAFVLMNVGRPQQDGEDGTRLPSIPATDALPQTDKPKLAELSAFNGVSFPSLPSTEISSSPEDPQALLSPHAPRLDLEAVTKQSGHLSRNTVLLQLEPPELGHLRVQVRLTETRLAAAFWAESPEVHALLHAHLPILHQALNQQGFQTQQISVALATDGFVEYSGQFSDQHSAFQPFSQRGEQGTPGSIRGTLIPQRMITDKYEHDGLVNVVI